jgi:hypothetical protein
MINNCLNLVDAGELQEAENRLDELEKMLGSFDTEVIRAKTLLGFLSRRGNEADPFCQYVVAYLERRL